MGGCCESRALKEKGAVQKPKRRTFDQNTLIDLTYNQEEDLEIQYLCFFDNALYHIFGDAQELAFEEKEWHYSEEVKAVVKMSDKRAFVFLNTGKVLHLNLDTFKVDKICENQLTKGCEAGIKTFNTVFLIGSFGCGQLVNVSEQEDQQCEF